MNWTTVRKRALYLAEALAIMLAIIVGLNPTLISLVAIFSVPAFALALVGVVRPGYLDRLGFADPRGGYRRYLHVCAVLCFGVVDLAVVNVVIHAR